MALALGWAASGSPLALAAWHLLSRPACNSRLNPVFLENGVRFLILAAFGDAEDRLATFHV